MTTFPERAKERAREKHPVDNFYGHHLISPEDFNHLIDTLLTEAYEEIESEIGERVNIIHGKVHGPSYTHGYNQAHTKALEAARKTLLGKE